MQFTVKQVTNFKLTEMRTTIFENVFLINPDTGRQSRLERGLLYHRVNEIKVN